MSLFVVCGLLNKKCFNVSWKEGVVNNATWKRKEEKRFPIEF